jgi:hypothetical protein
VLLAQINLLWVAALHRHAEEVSVRAAPVCGGDWQSYSAFDDGRLCTACQIVRHSAGRPSLDAPALKPAGSTPIGFTPDPGELTFRQPSVAYGRAPPLG